MATLICNFTDVMGEPIAGTATISSPGARLWFGTDRVLLPKKKTQQVSNGSTTFTNVAPGSIVLTVEFSEQSVTFRTVVPNRSSVKLSECLESGFEPPSASASVAAKVAEFQSSLSSLRSQVESATRSASQAVQGLAGKSDKSHTHTRAEIGIPNYYSSAISSSLVYRDSGGRAMVADPHNPLEIANKRYVDSKAASGTVSESQVASAVNTAVQGLFAGVEVKYNSVSKIVDGVKGALEEVRAVAGQLPQKAEVSHKHVWGDLLSVPKSPTDAPESASVMSRDSQGRSKVSDPSEPLHVANKKYVDAKVAEVVPVAPPVVVDTTPAWKHHLDVSKRYYAPVTYWWADQQQAQSNWHHLLQNADAVPFVILNPRSGPGTQAEPDFVDLVKRLEWVDKPKIGYVRTTQDFEPKLRTTRAKETILAEVAKHVEYYKVDGVFLDEMVNGWTPEQERLIPFYKDLYKQLKKLYGEQFLIVGNPGVVTKPELLECADVLMTFENTAAKYLEAEDNNVAPYHYKAFPPHRFIHVVHNVESKEQALKVLERMGRSNVASVFLTTDTFSGILGSESETNNPWDNLPEQWLVDMQLRWARRQQVDPGMRMFKLPGDSPIPQDAPDDVVFMRI